MNWLGQTESLQEVELVRLTGVENVCFLENLPDLRKLTLRSLSDLASLPHLAEGQKLSKLAVYDCEKLSDMAEPGETAQQWLVRQYAAVEGRNWR